MYITVLFLVTDTDITRVSSCHRHVHYSVIPCDEHRHYTCKPLSQTRILQCYSLSRTQTLHVQALVADTNISRVSPCHRHVHYSFIPCHGHKHYTCHTHEHYKGQLNKPIQNSPQFSPLLYSSIGCPIAYVSNILLAEKLSWQRWYIQYFHLQLGVQSPEGCPNAFINTYILNLFAKTRLS